MNYELNHLEYHIEGEGLPLLFLHGWGRNKDAFAPIISHLPETYKIITLSLPGFGNSPEPSKAWTVAEYAELVKKFLDEKLSPEERAALLCVTHSYGGRLAGKIKSFKKLVQIASAGVKPKRSPKYHVGLFFYKMLKALAELPFIGAIFRRPHIAYRNLRSSDDYKNASPVMKEALAYAINHDQKKDFSEITCPTLLIWGEADDITPLWMGKTMEKLIADSALITYPNATHQVLTERAAEIAIVIDEFFRNEVKDRKGEGIVEREKPDSGSDSPNQEKKDEINKVEVNRVEINKDNISNDIAEKVEVDKVEVDKVEVDKVEVEVEAKKVNKDGEVLS